MTTIIDGTLGLTTPTYGGAVTAEYTVPVTAFKNRIINGAMQIDQRNAGASVTPANGQYLVDRWQAALTQASKFTAQQSSTAPSGFVNSLLITSSSAYSVTSTDQFYIEQPIEGLNCFDLSWGSVSAQAVTLSFWVRSSLTGTFSGHISNSGYSRNYPFTYTISSANTWEQKTVTISGDQTGTWLTTNGAGIRVGFNLGFGANFNGTANTWTGSTLLSVAGSQSVVGTNGATFYITGVQLEKGSTATSFDYRPYGTELQLCYRYFEKTAIPYNQQHAIYYDGSQVNSMYVPFEVIKRASPTCTVTTEIKQFCNYGGGGAINATTVTINSGPYAYQYQYAGTSMGNGPIMNMGVNTAVSASAEL